MSRFTTFAHKPHISAVGSKGCAACHQLNQTSGDYPKTYEKGDPGVYAPNFQYVEKALCATCHTKQSAWESCTLCHNYHVSVPIEQSSGMSRRATAIQAPNAQPADQRAMRPER